MNEKKKIFDFSGTVARRIFGSDDFKVYAINVDNVKYPAIKRTKYGNVTIMGELPDLQQDGSYNIKAEECESKYGIGYKVFNISRDVPSTSEDMYNFLKEILTETQAKTLYEVYPDIVQRVKNNNLADIDFNKLKGIKQYTFDNIKKKIIENYCLADLVTTFKGYISLSVIRKLYDKYTSIDVLKQKLKQDPYKCLCGISGIGFKKADSILLEIEKVSKENVAKGEASIIEFDKSLKTSQERCMACVRYVLEENQNEGHTKMNLADLRSECMKLAPACVDYFTTVIKDELFYYNKDKMEASLRKTYETEFYIATRVLCAVVDNIHNVWDYDVNKYRKVGEFELSEEQMQILRVVCDNNIAILNGFAGSGKTASMRGLITMLNDNVRTYRLFSPTGRAAKVLAENTGNSASTIHRGLGYMPPNLWQYNEDNKLQCDIVIVDEFSMVDIWLFQKLLEAIDFKKTKLLLIGDNAQLPSVSCGNLLHDFMIAHIIPTVTLSKIFRYSSGGLMRVATDTRCSKPYLTSDMKSKATTFGEAKDYMFIDLASEVIPNNVVALYKKLLQSGYTINDIQVLSAKNVGDCGSVQLNGMLQKVANPNYGSQVNMQYGDTTYYQGDLILQCENNYKAEIDMNHWSKAEIEEYKATDESPTAFVANGETGIIEDIFNSYMVVNFNGVHIRYKKNDLASVKLGYAISIFKAQGGGFKVVILCTPQSHTFMLNNNLLYTGLTRTKERCYHLGTLHSVNQSIMKKANLLRHTFMQNMLLDNDIRDKCKEAEKRNNQECIQVENIGTNSSPIKYIDYYPEELPF